MLTIHNLYQAIYNDNSNGNITQTSLLLQNPDFNEVSKGSLEISVLKSLLPECTEIEMFPIDITPLHYALMMNEDIAMLLINHYDRLNNLERDDAELSSKRIKLSEEYENAAEAQPSKYNINAPNECGTTALHFASKMGYDNIVKRLLESGYETEIDIQDDLKDTALHLASLSNNKAVVELLLEHGADVNISNDNGDMAIHIAAENSHKDALELLLLHSETNREALNINDHTALNIASCNGSRSIVTCLLKNHVNVSQADLDPAIGCYNRRIIETLTTINNIQEVQNPEAKRAIIESIGNKALLSIISTRFPECVEYFDDNQNTLLVAPDETDSEYDSEYDSDSDSEYDDLSYASGYYSEASLVGDDYSSSDDA